MNVVYDHDSPLINQFGALYLSLLVASVSDLKKARIAAEGIVCVLTEPAVDMDNLSDEGFRPVCLHAQLSMLYSS
jgi:hypothetical protein